MYVYSINFLTNKSVMTFLCQKNICLSVCSHCLIVRACVETAYFVVARSSAMEKTSGRFMLLSLANFSLFLAILARHFVNMFYLAEHPLFDTKLPNRPTGII